MATSLLFQTDTISLNNFSVLYPCLLFSGNLLSLFPFFCSLNLDCSFSCWRNIRVLLFKWLLREWKVSIQRAGPANAAKHLASRFQLFNAALQNPGRLLLLEATFYCLSCGIRMVLHLFIIYVYRRPSWSANEPIECDTEWGTPQTSSLPPFTCLHHGSFPDRNKEATWFFSLSFSLKDRFLLNFSTGLEFTVQIRLAEVTCMCHIYI